MLDLGYVFDSYAHVRRRWTAGRRASGQDAFDRTGCTVLGAGHRNFGARSVYAKNPIKSLAGVKGVKLRVLPTTAFIETFKLMGAIPTQFPSTSCTPRCRPEWWTASSMTRPR